MSNLCLITENVDIQDFEIINESVGEEKRWRIKGPYLQSEDKNQNGRVYSRDIISREVDKYQIKIKEKRSVGELNHPPSQEVNFERAAHLVTSLKMDGKYAMGESTISNNLALGHVVIGLLKEGIKFGVSSRGIGTLNGFMVNDDFSLICIDIVSEPSATDAWVNGILESKDWLINKNPILENSIDEFEKKISKNGSKNIMGDLNRMLRDLRIAL